MRIDKIELVHVRIPLHRPFKISSGVVSQKDAIVVAVRSEDLVGYGEASPMEGSFYSEDSPESTWICLTTAIIPRLFSEKDLHRSRLESILDEIEGNSFAKAGIEGAFWDLEAKQRKLSLCRTVGGQPKRIPSGLAVGIELSLRDLLDTIEKYLADGYKRVKIKIEPGWDLEPVKSVRKEFGDIPLMVDANAAYDRDSLPIFQELDRFDLQMFEQPLKKDDLIGHAELQSKVKTPVCLDESAGDRATVLKAIELGSCRIINLKIQRMGGFAKAKELHDLCQNAGVPVWAGTMPELGIGSAQAIHLATLPNFSYPTDVESSSRWFVDDIIVPWVEVRDGFIEVPDDIGYGFNVDERKLRKYAVRSEVFH